VLASTGYPGLTWSEIVQVLSLSGVREIEKSSNKRNDLTRDGRPGPPPTAYQAMDERAAIKTPVKISNLKEQR